MHPTLRRLLIGGALIGAAFLMVQGIDSGLDSAWPRAAQVAWRLSPIVLVLAGAGFLAQALRTMLGKTEIAWFPTRRSVWTRTGIGPALVAGCAAIALVAAVAAWWPAYAGRVGIGAMGGLFVLMAVLRTRAVFKAPDVRDWQRVFGVRAVRVFYGLLGVGLILIAVLANPS